jgi:hypothetical protein
VAEAITARRLKDSGIDLYPLFLFMFFLVKLLEIFDCNSWGRKGSFAASGFQAANVLMEVSKNFPSLFVHWEHGFLP